MMQYWRWDGGWHMPLFGVGPLLLILLIGGGVWFFSRQGRSSVNNAQSNAGRDILDRRYASGEITKDQYDQMKRDLLG